MRPTVKELYEYFNKLIPSSLSLDWDNDGLMLTSDPNAEVKRVLCALDCDKEAVEKAVRLDCDLIITHHPLIFKPMKALTDQKFITLINSKISVMSFHTRLDILDGGVNDRLVQLIGLRDCYKFAENVGRIGYLSPMSFDEITTLLKDRVGGGVYRLSDTKREIKKVAVVSGSGGDFVNEALYNGVDLFISGEIGYHHTLDAYDGGMSSIELGHDVSERHIVHYFKEKINERYDAVEAII